MKNTIVLNSWLADFNNNTLRKKIDMISTGIPLKIKSMSPLFLVSNLDNATNFYTKILGFEISFSYDDFYCGLVKDSCSIHLKSGSPSAEERIKRRTNEDIDITFTIDNIEAAYEYIKNTTVTIIQPLRHMPYGSEFYISDPDGYILAFLRTA